MPTQQAHLQQAEHNESLYRHLAAAAPTYADWQITALFYAALHYVDSYLAKTNIHPPDHAQRQKWVWMVGDLKSIAIDYALLRDRSQDARYRLVSFPAGFESQLYNNQFSRVRAHLLKII